MQARDPFRITDQLEPAALEVIASRLEMRGSHPRFVAALTEYLDRMDVGSRAQLLDLGCGTGIAARAIARRPAFNGTVLGIDLSSHLVQIAQRLAVEEKLADRVNFRPGDTHSLDLPSDSFDGVVAHTLISHVDDPAKVLAEMRRVLRPGGVAAIFDGDYASLTLELADPARSRRMDDAIIGSLVTHPRVLRQLPRLAQQAGFAVDAVLPTIITEVGAADFWESAISAYAKLVPGAGLLTDEEMSAWSAELMDASARGVFFGSCIYYAYILRIA